MKGEKKKTKKKHIDADLLDSCAQITDSTTDDESSNKKHKTSKTVTVERSGSENTIMEIEGDSSENHIRKNKHKKKNKHGEKEVESEFDEDAGQESEEKIKDRDHDENQQSSRTIGDGDEETTGDANHLEMEDPEKAAMRERKRQKRQEKKEAKRQKMEAAEAARGTGEPLALEYLKKWDTDRDNWTFQKVRQVWLLQNMYNVEKIPSDNFPILLRYLEGLKGHARNVTVEKAEKLLASAEKDSDDEEEKGNDADGDKSDTNDKDQSTDVKFSEEQYERVRQVIQLLS